MRDLTRPELIKPTACTALATAMLCLPRLSLWTTRVYPIWYLDAIIFTGSFVLWGFVFAWHSKYMKRPLFTFDMKEGGFAFATVAGLTVAVLLHIFIDPLARRATPEDFPANLEQWLAAGLFTLSLSQLFLVFAPFAWSMRLFKQRTIAFVLTVLFGLAVFVLKTRRAPTPLSPALFGTLLLTRFIMEMLAVGIYLRGGVLPTLWLGFLVHLHFWPG
jgi:magnesium-transporting ATPase (P-type)